MAVLDWLRRNLWLPLGALYLVALWVHGQNQWDGGYKKGKAEGDAAVADLRLVHAEQARQAAIDSRVQLLQQIERANQAEALLLSQQDGHDQDHQQLQERIPHVTTVYRPAPAAAPVVIPRCVFTAGWVRDFNLALGAGLPAAGGSAATTSAAQAAWPPPVLTPNYWKAVSLRQTSWPMPRTTAAGPVTTLPNSMPCSTCSRTDTTWM